MAIRASKIADCEMIAKEFVKIKTVLLTSHVAPDGDALGSILALREICLQLPNTEVVDAVIVGKMPDIYLFLPGIEFIKSPDDDRLLMEYDLSVSLDCASKERLGSSEKVFSSGKKSINVDHHGSNTLYSELNIIEEFASATGEMVYEIAQCLNVKVTPTIATNIYASILTDTGGFKFSNTTSRALLVCSRMIEFGADPQRIFRQCYEHRPLAMMKLHGHCIVTAQISEDRRIAWTVVTRNLLSELGATDDHTDGIIELIRQINTVEIAVLFKEMKDGNIKVSFRSKEKDICLLATELLGGGHKCAAGCTVKGMSLEDTINYVIPRVAKILE